MSKAITESIEIRNLSKSFGEKTLFENISFQVNHGEKVGLAGLNGCGKSTLLKIIAGEGIPDSGRVLRIPGELKIGYLPQWFEFSRETLGEILEEALNHAGVAEEWRRRVIIERVLAEVELNGMPLDFPARMFSGGERTRVRLAELLIMEPEFLLLDEPTNFLDIRGLSWMENFIKSRNQAVIMVSHDRYFLDRTVDRIVEMDDGLIFEYTGNYSQYREAKSARIQKQLEDYHRQRETIRKLQFQAQRIKQFAANKEASTVNDFVRAKARQFARKAKAIEKRVEKIERVEKPRGNYMARIRFEQSASSRIAARVENLSKSFGDRVLYEDVNFTILAGEKVGILGENGTGKTTLLKMLQGSEQPTAGKAFLMDHSKIGYFSQVFEELDPEIPAVEQLMSHSGLNLPEARQFLASFLFLGESVFKKVGVLSIGEQSRLALACVKAREPEALILDEPTSHLDVDTTEILEKALVDYTGTIIIVTHDRVLLDRITKRLLVIEEGKINDYPGNYTYYREKHEEASRATTGDGEFHPERIRSQKLRLECQIAKVSAKLGWNGLTEEERQSLEAEFDRLKEEMAVLK